MQEKEEICQHTTFFVPPNEELEIAPQKMKVKRYMYPQMKNPVGMLISFQTWV
jgi:hypothetical protein